MKKVKLFTMVFLIITIFSGLVVKAEEVHNNINDEKIVVLFDAKEETQKCVRIMKLEDFKKIIEQSIISIDKEKGINKATINDGIIISITKDDQQINYHLGNDGVVRKCRLSLTYSEDGFIDDGFEFLYDEVYFFNSSVNETLWESAEELLYEDLDKKSNIRDSYFRELRPVVYPSEGINYLETIYKCGVLPFNIGVDDGEDFYITREEYCQLIFNYLKRTEKFLEVSDDNVFEDTADKRIGALREFGIVKGIEKNLFNPSGYLTREEAAVFLKRTANYLDIMFLEDKVNRFEDDEHISNWAKNDIYVLTCSGIIKGEENGKFSPKKNLNRFDALRLVVRLIDFYEGDN